MKDMTSVTYVGLNHEDGHNLVIHLKPIPWFRHRRMSSAPVSPTDIDPREKWKVLNVESTAPVMFEKVISKKPKPEEDSFSKLLAEISEMSADISLSQNEQQKKATDEKQSSYVPKRAVFKNPPKPTVCKNYRKLVAQATDIPGSLISVLRYKEDLKGWVVHKSKKKREYAALAIGGKFLVISTKGLFDKGRSSVLIKPDKNIARVFKKFQEIKVLHHI
jgi:hypothetical protein